MANELLTGYAVVLDSKSKPGCQFRVKSAEPHGVHAEFYKNGFRMKLLKNISMEQAIQMYEEWEAKQ